MEPELISASGLLSVFDELRARELVFHHPGRHITREACAAMTDEAFREIGASGQCYGRESVLDVLEQRGKDPVEAVWTMRDFRCQPLAPDVFLLTYTLQQPGRLTRRASIWRRTADGWKIVFHQGTVAQEP